MSEQDQFVQLLDEMGVPYVQEAKEGDTENLIRRALRHEGPDHNADSCSIVTILHGRGYEGFEACFVFGPEGEFIVHAIVE